MTDLPHAPDAPRLIPLALIDAGALPRDRLALDPQALQELAASIVATGLRHPIEVFENLREGALPYALISGLRRLSALRYLHDDCGLDRFAAIPAVIRNPADLPAALASMVEENDLRADIAPWDKARIAIEAARDGHFASLDAAVDGLYPSASRQRRARIRAVADAVAAFDAAFDEPAALSERQLLRLAAAARAGFGDLILAALRERPATRPGAQFAHIETILREAEEDLRSATPPDPRPGRPRRHTRPREGLSLRRERTPEGWALRFSGREATGALIEDIMDMVEAWVGK